MSDSKAVSQEMSHWWLKIEAVKL